MIAVKKPTSRPMSISSASGLPMPRWQLIRGAPFEAKRLSALQHSVPPEYASAACSTCDSLAAAEQLAMVALLPGRLTSLHAAAARGLWLRVQSSSKCSSVSETAKPVGTGQLLSRPPASQLRRAWR